LLNDLLFYSILRKSILSFSVTKCNINCDDGKGKDIGTSFFCFGVIPDAGKTKGALFVAQINQVRGIRGTDYKSIGHYQTAPEPDELVDAGLKEYSRIYEFGNI
jgi:hypothetical protein